jgi:hypothetical protein
MSYYESALRPALRSFTWRSISGGSRLTYQGGWFGGRQERILHALRAPCTFEREYARRSARGIASRALPMAVVVWDSTAVFSETQDAERGDIGPPRQYVLIPHPKRPVQVFSRTADSCLSYADRSHVFYRSRL